MAIDSRPLRHSTSHSRTKNPSKRRLIGEREQKRPQSGQSQGSQDSGSSYGSSSSNCSITSLPEAKSRLRATIEMNRRVVHRGYLPSSSNVQQPPSSFAAQPKANGRRASCPGALPKPPKPNGLARAPCNGALPNPSRGRSNTSMSNGYAEHLEEEPTTTQGRGDIQALGGMSHRVLGHPLWVPAFLEGLERAVFGAGCFWGTEKGFWKLPGVYTTATGYAGGLGQEPRYDQVKKGITGHAECTLVLFDPLQISFVDLLHQFWRCHNPTQGDRQGNDRGSQYRSCISCSTDEQRQLAEASRQAFSTSLRGKRYGAITTEIWGPKDDVTFWYAEPKHQQYLAKPKARPYCSAEPTGVPVPRMEGAKLPPPFWKHYDASVRAPNQQLPLWSSSPDSKKASERALVAREAEAGAHKRQQEAQHQVTIQYCGGCGFANRAEALAEELRGEAGVEVGLIQDQTSTGRFDVRVKQKDGQFRLVHSKQGAPGGFVDSRVKTRAIAEAIREAMMDEGHGGKGTAEHAPQPREQDECGS